MGKGAQLSQFHVGQVKAHMWHGLGPTKIAELLGKKPDGSGNNFSDTAVKKCMDRLRANKKWEGQRTKGSGAPRQTTAAQDKKIINYVLKKRGQEKVTIAVLKRDFRELGNSLLEERLHDASLWWFRRRDKARVDEEYVPGRIRYGNWVKKQSWEYLHKWMYSDGCIFFRDRTQAEAGDSHRRSLGKFVWRESGN